MLKLVLATLWLGVNLRSLIYLVIGRPCQLSTERGPVPVGTLVLNLRNFLSQRQDNVLEILGVLKAQPDLQANFRKALTLTVIGLLAELGVYGAITFSFESWLALAFGALVLTVHLQSVILLLLLSFLVGNWQWFVLTFKKAQVLVVPALVLEILWLAYLVLLWSGLGESLLALLA